MSGTSNFAMNINLAMAWTSSLWTVKSGSFHIKMILRQDRLGRILASISQSALVALLSFYDYFAD